MILAYPVIFTPTNDKKDTILVYIPDLDGATEGHGITNAIHMARDYIGSILQDKSESEYPEASRLTDVDVGSGIFSDVGDSFVSIVDIDIEEYSRIMDNTPVRRNVSLPNWLNKKANEAHINVSRVLQDALMEKLV